MPTDIVLTQIGHNGPFSKVFSGSVWTTFFGAGHFDFYSSWYSSMFIPEFYIIELNMTFISRTERDTRFLIESLYDYLKLSVPSVYWTSSMTSWFV